MMKTTLEQAVLAYRVLAEAKNGKMKDGDKFNMLKIRKELKKYATEHDDYLKDIRESLKPDGYDEIVIKEKPSLAERAVLLKYEKDIEKCMAEEYKKEIELDFVPLSEEGMKGFMESNDFTFGQIGAVYDVIGE